LTKDIQTVLLSIGQIESDVREAVRIAAGNAVQVVEVIKDLHAAEELAELIKSIDQNLTDLAVIIPKDLESMKSTLEIIADNTSGEIPDDGF
jgi:hypothetical protein